MLSMENGDSMLCKLRRSRVYNCYGTRTNTGQLETIRDPSGIPHPAHPAFLPIRTPSGFGHRYAHRCLWDPRGHAPFASALAQDRRGSWQGRAMTSDRRGSRPYAMLDGGAGSLQPFNQRLSKRDDVHSPGLRR